LKIRLLEAAERDLARGADFYEANEAGIGAYFIDCLSSDIQSLQIFAGTHAKKFGLYRLLSKRFPCSIYYDLFDEDVVIVGVFGDRQSPETIEASLRQRGQ
jgi:plasmid stabilization system protein ParE